MNYKKILIKGIKEFKNGDYDNCRKTFTSALKKFPKEIEIYTYLIPVLINQNKLEEATKHANELYKLNDKNEVGLTYLGIIFFQEITIPYLIQASYYISWVGIQKQ